MITEKIFGITRRGEEVRSYSLTNKTGMAVTVISYGCAITRLVVPDRDGKGTDVSLGYDTLSEYETNDAYLGAVVGRFANRLENAAFELGGKTYRLAKNDGPNHLHGGLRGFDKYVWAGVIQDDELIFSRTSPDGEEGYPGTVQLQVSYCLTEKNTLTIAYKAVSDADTVLNLTNHTYFNLNGHQNGTVLDHVLQLDAAFYTENSPYCLPTGVISPVAGTPFDFTKPKPLGQDIGKEHIQLEYGKGYDHNWVLGGQGLKKAAELYAPATGILMTAYTTKPGLQVYTGNMISQRAGKDGACYGPHSGVCLETQYFPNSMACANFPSPVLKQGETYRHVTEYTFSVL